jgi:hypothetical protein
MPTTTEPVLALRYAYSTLSADTVLAALTTPAPSISVVPVPTGATFPRIVIESPSAAENLNALQDGYARIWSQPRIEISIISANENLDDIDAIAARITTLLDGVGGVAVEGGVIVTFSQDWSLVTADLQENSYRSKIVQQYSTAVTATA